MTQNVALVNNEIIKKCKKFDEKIHGMCRFMTMNVLLKVIIVEDKVETVSKENANERVIKA